MRDEKQLPDECFVMMPFSDPDNYEKGHFRKVYDQIFLPAINKADFRSYRVDEAEGTNIIHHTILSKLLECPIAICDLSSRNPNVLFELGFRQAFNKPVVLVQEVGSPRIFDLGLIKTYDYSKSFFYEDVSKDQDEISRLIRYTFEQWQAGETTNSLINLLNITSPATLSKSSEKDKTDGRLTIIIDQTLLITQRLASLERQYQNLERYLVRNEKKEKNFNTMGIHEEKSMRIFHNESKLSEIKKLIEIARTMQESLQAGELQQSSLYELKEILKNINAMISKIEGEKLTFDQTRSVDLINRTYSEIMSKVNSI
jgi:hypothetical protein